MHFGMHAGNGSPVGLAEPVWRGFLCTGMHVEKGSDSGLFKPSAWTAGMSLRCGEKDEHIETLG